MLALHPTDVTLLGRTLRSETIEAIAVSREASRSIEERTDNGPHVVFADAPEQRVLIALLRTLDGPEPDGPRPGEMGALVFTTGPGGADAPAQRVSAAVVVRSVRIEVSRRRGAAQRIELIAVSTTGGAADPVTVEEVAP
jgi:hypothetical protein